MKKLPYAIALLLVVVVSAYFIYQHFLPKFIARAVVSSELSSYMPEKYKSTIESLEDSINSKAENVIRITAAYDVSFELLLNAVDEVKESDVRAAFKELDTIKITNVEQVFDIGKKHIKIDSFDPEILREAFLKNVEIKHVKKGMRYVKNHDLLNTLDSETARNIVKQILIQKKEKIEKKLE